LHRGSHYTLLTAISTDQPDNAELTSPAGVGEFTVPRQSHEARKDGPVMSVDQRVALDLDDLPMDVFELVDQGLRVESLTAGHGMIQMAASTVVSCSCFCCCGAVDQERTHDELEG
jgi:hypothetical protein